MSDTAIVLQKVAEQEESEREAYAQLEEVATQLVAEVRGTKTKPYTIDDDEDYEFATDLLVHAKKQIKEIKARSKTVTQPMYQALEAFRDLYRPTLRAYEEVEKLLKKKTGEYALQKRQEEEEAMRLIAEASQEGDFEKAMEVSKSMERAPEKKGITTTMSWVFEVTDMEKVPEKYTTKTINYGEMASYTQKFNGGKPDPIPGIRFYEKPKVIVRTK